MERAVKQHYESLGYTVIRSAGSHSPIDLIAIPKKGDRFVLLIQCKNSTLSQPARDKLEESLSQFGRSGVMLIPVVLSKEWKREVE
jgi:Holliday junction resolvase